MDSVLNVECSLFERVTATTPGAVNLLEWLKNDQYRHQLEQLRALTDEDEQKHAKGKMPCITPSGTFSKRGKSYLISHTGLLAVDIDYSDNLHLSNFDSLKKELCKLPTVAYCGLSVRGKGYWLLIPVAHPEKHEDHFRYIEQYFKGKGLTIDPACKNVDRLRFYSYDPDAYFNHSAKPLQAYYSPPVVKQRVQLPARNYSTDKPIWEHYNNSTDFFSVLQKHGWTISRTSGNKTYFIRPGKKFDQGAEYDIGKGVFYVFTTNAPPFEGSKGYNPFNVYALLEHNGDFSQAAKTLIRNSTAYQSRSGRSVSAYQKPSAVSVISAISKPTPQGEPHRPIQGMPSVPLVQSANGEGEDSQKSDEEIIYSRIVAEHPLVEALVDRLQMVSATTGKRINKVEYSQGPGTAQPAEIRSSKPAGDKAVNRKNWDEEMAELEDFFGRTAIPAAEIRLNSYSTITNARLYIDSHLATLRNYNGNSNFLPYLERMKELKAYLTKKQ